MLNMGRCLAWFFKSRLYLAHLGSIIVLVVNSFFVIYLHVNDPNKDDNNNNNLAIIFELYLLNRVYNIFRVISLLVLNHTATCMQNVKGFSTQVTTRFVLYDSYTGLCDRIYEHK